MMECFSVPRRPHIHEKASIHWVDHWDVWLSIQLKTDVVEGRLRCNHEQAIVLASYSLQVEQSISEYLLQKHNFSGGVWRPRSWEAHGRISQRLSTSPKTSGGSVWGELRSILIGQRRRMMTDADNKFWNRTGLVPWLTQWLPNTPALQVGRPTRWTLLLPFGYLCWLYFTTQMTKKYSLAMFYSQREKVMTTFSTSVCGSNPIICSCCRNCPTTCRNLLHRRSPAAGGLWTGSSAFHYIFSLGPASFSIYVYSSVSFEMGFLQKNPMTTQNAWLFLS